MRLRIPGEARDGGTQTWKLKRRSRKVRLRTEALRLGNFRGEGGR